MAVFKRKEVNLARCRTLKFWRNRPSLEVFYQLRSVRRAGKIAPLFLRNDRAAHRGRLGFDGGDEIKGACREGSDSRKTIAATFIVANEDNYALAA